MAEISLPLRNLQPIDLARQPDFPLALLTVKPSTREIVRPDASRDVLEPRVMQVLTALNLAAPNVVSRDDLIAQCWEGRVVGDDAINGAIGKLRRLSEADQGAFFTIETVPRVGYRLTVVGDSSQVAAAGKDEHPNSNNRRALLTASVALAATTIAGGGWWFAARRPALSSRTDEPPAAAALIARGKAMVRQGRLENQSQAAGLFQQAIDLAPDNADAWGGLALADAFVAHNGSKAAYQAQNMRALSAIDRALALDAGNALAWEAKAVAIPSRGYWFESDQALRKGLTVHPDDGSLLLHLANNFVVVGRMREASAIMKHLIAVSSGHIDPAIAWISLVAFSGAGEWVEADQAAARGAAQFPRHPLTWIHRAYLLMFTGRPAEALIMLRDVDNRPPDQRDNDINGVIAVAAALQSGARDEIDKAAAIQLVQAQTGGRDAENAFMFLAGLGKMDEAFDVARACYLAPGAYDPPGRFAPNLFLPGCRAMRKDPRFANLMDLMGLTAYWQKVGVKPDFQIYQDG